MKARGLTARSVVAGEGLEFFGALPKGSPSRCSARSATASPKAGGALRPCPPPCRDRHAPQAWAGTKAERPPALLQLGPVAGEFLARLREPASWRWVRPPLITSAKALSFCRSASNQGAESRGSGLGRLGRPRPYEGRGESVSLLDWLRLDVRRWGAPGSGLPRTAAHPPRSPGRSPHSRSVGLDVPAAGFCQTRKGEFASRAPLATSSAAATMAAVAQRWQTLLAAFTSAQAALSWPKRPPHDRRRHPLFSLISKKWMERWVGLPPPVVAGLAPRFAPRLSVFDSAAAGWRYPSAGGNHFV